MSFLQSLKKQKNLLKPSDTFVTYPDGSRYVEHSGSKQRELVKKNETLAAGFVIDTAPDNIPAQILPHLFIGSQDCCEPNILNQFNINIVLSIGIEILENHAHNITYIFIECLDLPETDLSLILTRSNPVIKHAINTRQNIFVHCNAGVSRSASVVIGFLITEMGYCFDDAYALVKNARTCIQPNSGFIKQLVQIKTVDTNQ